MKNKNYKILEHPADVRVQAFGKTKEELFLNAMLGMNAILKSQIKSPRLRQGFGGQAKPKVTRRIKIKSLDLNALLVDFLSEVLYLGQVNKEVYEDVKFTKFSDKELEGELFGNKIESFGEDIKAVTYHGLEIKKNKEGLLEGIVLFDI